MKMGKETGRKYRPSNGTEGEYFVDEHCMNCFHCDPDPCGKKQCDILCRSLIYNTSDPEYPKEWVYDENDKPTCTAWKKWDWGNDGNPDDPENPKFVPPDDPNQLCLPFELESIESQQSEILTLTT